MIIAITGTTSGIGLALSSILESNHNVIKISRDIVNLNNIDQVDQFNIPYCDMLINCAGTGIGGKIDFANHSNQDIIEIVNVNLLSPILLTKKALLSNPCCKIINITSTNNNRYYPNDLIYSLTKKSLAEFGSMLKVDYPDLHYLEVRVGLTKTNFNNNRYKNNPDRFNDIYQKNHLTPETVSAKIVNVIFDNNINYIEISP